MPFTFSHPAIVLSLKKLSNNKLSMTGLIIGSLSPDFEYFIRMKMKGEYSHTLMGNLWLNLPLSIVVCLIFHLIIKIPMIDNSPKCVQQRLLGLRNLDWYSYFIQHWRMVCLSIIIGGYSHIFWDLFTHKNTLITHYLKFDIISLFGIPIFKILQHTSSFIGMLIILIYFFSLKKADVKTVSPKLTFWIQCIFLVMLILIIRFLFGLQLVEYGSVIVSGISAIMLALTLVATHENIKSKQ